MGLPAWESDKTIPEEDLDLFYRIGGIFAFGQWTRVLVEIDASWDRLWRHASLRPQPVGIKGRSCKETDDLATALRIFAEGRRIDPENSSIRDDLRGLEASAFNEICHLIGLDDWKGVEDLCPAYLGAFPATTKVEWKLGTSLDEQGKSEEVEAIFRDLVPRAAHSAFQSLCLHLHILVPSSSSTLLPTFHHHRVLLL